MTRKKSQLPPSAVKLPELYPLATDKDTPWGGFVNIPVSDADKEKFGFWFTEAEPVMIDTLSELMWSGLKLSVVFDGENDCFIATLTGKPHPDVDFRCAMSARHSSLPLALGLLLYKHFILADQDWSQFTQKGEKRKWNFG